MEIKLATEILRSMQHSINRMIDLSTKANATAGGDALVTIGDIKKKQNQVKALDQAIKAMEICYEDGRMD